MRPVILLALAAFAGLLAGCRSQQPIEITDYSQAKKLLPQYERLSSSPRGALPWLGPPPGMATRLRRRAATEAVLCGHVDLLLENGQAVPQAAAIIMVGDKPTYTDQAGNYAVTLAAGQQPVRAGGVGFLWSRVTLLQVAASDSIQLNFRLLQDLRPLIN